ncbi:hypothetical protein THAOC_19973 [Thalassiosira oceanica]|uniref:Uncharacterized protein n=1 Tax=Thalassiosira oceanica TaxID=159749 RepID=K0SFT0_THAOC|nr:hypothetical protein THAOC_19973 [Thalassiosira oceanica]|eukprot:EJK59766.1 hypothetical protein THAOC_19973 [Thalassiosira oceanica]
MHGKKTRAALAERSEASADLWRFVVEPSVVDGRTTAHQFSESQMQRIRCRESDAEGRTAQSLRFGDVPGSGMYSDSDLSKAIRRVEGFDSRNSRRPATTYTTGGAGGRGGQTTSVYA